MALLVPAQAAAAASVRLPRNAADWATFSQQERAAAYSWVWAEYRTLQGQGKLTLTTISAPSPLTITGSVDCGFQINTQSWGTYTSAWAWTSTSASVYSIDTGAEGYLDTWYRERWCSMIAPLVSNPSDGWHWAEDAFPPVAFCVRVLVLDGLSVPPFDRHPDGDGGLRALGLGADLWREWVSVLLRQHAIMGEHARSLGTPDAREPMLERARAAAGVLRHPGSFCPGPGELQARLDALFADYAAAGEDWKRRTSDPRPRLGSGRQQRALWQALTPFHTQLPPLSIFLVEYPEPVIMPLPPANCLIAPAANAEGYARQVVVAAISLAMAP